MPGLAAAWATARIRAMAAPESDAENLATALEIGEITSAMPEGSMESAQSGTTKRLAGTLKIDMLWNVAADTGRVDRPALILSANGSESGRGMRFIAADRVGYKSKIPSTAV